MRTFLKCFSDASEPGFFVKHKAMMDKYLAKTKSALDIIQATGIGALASSERIHVRTVACKELASDVSAHKVAASEMSCCIEFVTQSWKTALHIQSQSGSSETKLADNVKKVGDLTEIAKKMRDKQCQAHLIEWVQHLKSTFKLEDSAKQIFDKSWESATKSCEEYLEAFVETIEQPDEFDAKMRPLIRKTANMDHNLQQVLHFHEHNQQRTEEISTARVMVNCCPSAAILRMLNSSKQINTRTKADMAKMEFATKREHFNTLCSKDSLPILARMFDKKSDMARKFVDAVSELAQKSNDLVEDKMVKFYDDGLKAANEIVKPYASAHRILDSTEFLAEFDSAKLKDLTPHHNKLAAKVIECEDFMRMFTIPDAKFKQFGDRIIDS